MITFRNGCAIAAVALALPMAAMSSGHAAPLAPSQPLAAAHAGADNSLVTQVQWRRRGYYYGGAGLGVGLAAGALLDSAQGPAAAIASAKWCVCCVCVCVCVCVSGRVRFCVCARVCICG